MGLSACVIVLLAIWPIVDVSLAGDQYVFLGHRITEARIDVDNLPPANGDYVKWNGHKYVLFGPLPAVLLVPFLPLLNLPARVVAD